MVAPRRHVTVNNAVHDASGNPRARTLRSSVGPERFAPEDVANPGRLVAALTRLDAKILGLARLMLGPIHVEKNFVVDNSGSPINKIAHNLNDKDVLWIIAGWRGNGVGSAPNIRDDRGDPTVLSDANTLFLKSSIVGTADILVLSVGA